jgi:hypothetical protein
MSTLGRLRQSRFSWYPWVCRAASKVASMQLLCFSQRKGRDCSFIALSLKQLTKKGGMWVCFNTSKVLTATLCFLLQEPKGEIRKASGPGQKS